MRQKFKMFSFVHVTKDLSWSMKHFDCDFDAIVGGTYSQIFGGTNINSYKLYQLKDGEIYQPIAWYYEDQLTLLSEQNREKAEQMIEDYNFRLVQ